MAYTKEELINMGLEDNKEIRSKIVTTNIFDNITSVKLSDKTKEKEEFAIDLYEEYMKRIDDLSDPSQENLLKTLLDNEHIINASKEESECISLAIRYLVNRLIINKNNLNDDILLSTHNLLIFDDLKEYRTYNTHYVGYTDKGTKIVDYLPISYDEIKDALSILFKYYNSKVDSNEVFIKPFIIHALLGTLQIFNDGNSRLARCIQHIELLDTTKDFSRTNLMLPPIYCSNNYYAFLKQYKDLIASIAVYPSNEAWDEWIRFNYNQLIGQIYANEDVINRVRKKG